MYSALLIIDLMLYHPIPLSAWCVASPLLNLGEISSLIFISSNDDSSSDIFINDMEPLPVSDVFSFISPFDGSSSVSLFRIISPFDYSSSFPFINALKHVIIFLVWWILISYRYKRGEEPFNSFLLLIKSLTSQISPLTLFFFSLFFFLIFLNLRS